MPLEEDPQHFEWDDIEIQIDSHFLGFTPLNAMKNGENHKIECVGIILYKPLLSDHVWQCDCYLRS